jgi:hypothetical protein
VGSTWTFAHGREPNWRNLMVRYAASAKIVDVDELPGLLYDP